MHHVASVYPVEIHLASLLAAGQPISGVTWDVVDTMNRDHAKENDGNAKEGTLALLANQQCGGGAAIRALSDRELDRAAPVSLNSDAPLTCQFMLEDHAVRHSTIALPVSGRRSAVSTWRLTCFGAEGARGGPTAFEEMIAG